MTWVRTPPACDEVETIISDARIPADRQMVYALEPLAGVRPREAAGLRWRHYDPTNAPDRGWRTTAICRR
jgi:hypothetical protein